MCKPISCIVTKDDVLFSSTSHRLEQEGKSMTTFHIIQSVLEVVIILLVAFAIYKIDTNADRGDKAILGLLPVKQDKPVVFTGRDILYEEDRK